MGWNCKFDVLKTAWTFAGFSMPICSIFFFGANKNVRCPREPRGARGESWRRGKGTWNFGNLTSLSFPTSRSHPQKSTPTLGVEVVLGCLKLIVGVFFVSWENHENILIGSTPHPARVVIPYKEQFILDYSWWWVVTSYWMGGRFGHVLSFEIGWFCWAVFGCKTIAVWSRCACFDEMRRKQIDIGKLKVSFSEQTGD